MVCDSKTSASHQVICIIFQHAMLDSSSTGRFTLIKREINFKNFDNYVIKSESHSYKIMMDPSSIFYYFILTYNLHLISSEYIVITTICYDIFSCAKSRYDILLFYFNLFWPIRNWHMHHNIFTIFLCIHCT